MSAKEHSIDALSDSQLVDKTRAGDVEAFSELVRRHERLVYKVALNFMRDTHLAEDMAQEAFLKAYRLLKGFRGDAAFSTWLYRVTTSVCLTEIARRKRRGEVALLPEHSSASFELPVDTLDLPEILRSCITRLPRRYADIVARYYIRGETYEEITERLKVPVGTLKTWMHRARKQLRTIVEKEIGAGV